MSKRTDISVGEHIYVLTKGIERFLFEINRGMFYHDYKSLFLTGKVHKTKLVNVSVIIDNIIDNKIYDYSNECVYNQEQFDDFCFVYENGPKIVKHVQGLVEMRERGADRLRIINALWHR